MNNETESANENRKYMLVLQDRIMVRPDHSKAYLFFNSVHAIIHETDNHYIIAVRSTDGEMVPAQFHKKDEGVDFKLGTKIELDKEAINFLLSHSAEDILNVKNIIVDFYVKPKPHGRKSG